MDLPTGGTVGEGASTHIPLSSLLPLGQVHTGPLGLRRQSHSHFFRSHGLVTGEKRQQMYKSPAKASGKTFAVTLDFQEGGEKNPRK